MKQMLAEESKEENDMSTKGCTANVILVVPNSFQGQGPSALIAAGGAGATVYCANAGDSRSVMGSAGKSNALSFDHKPTNSKERSRILKAGSFVNHEGRVNGNLNLSRAIGDTTYKKNKRVALKDQAITAFPDVKSMKITEKTDFIVMGCDGIWEFHNNQQVCDSIYLQMTRRVRIAKICEAFLETCCSPNIQRTMGKGCDNMSMILLDFRK